MRIITMTCKEKISTQIGGHGFLSATCLVADASYRAKKRTILNDSTRLIGKIVMLYILERSQKSRSIAQKREQYYVLDYVRTGPAVGTIKIMPSTRCRPQLYCTVQGKSTLVRENRSKSTENPQWCRAGASRLIDCGD